MRFLNLEQVADHMQGAVIESYNDRGFAVVYAGINRAGSRFVMINSAEGETVVTESM